MSATNSNSAAEQSAVQQALRSWFGDQPVTTQPLGAGHIHGTWLVTLHGSQTNQEPQKQQERYVLQRINQAVFAAPDKVIANLLSVLPDAQRTDQPPYALPTPIAARSGDYLVQCGSEVLADGGKVPGQWRLAKYIEHSRTLQHLASSAQAEAAGRAFGEFQCWLAAQQRSEFAEVIPGFHRLPRYLQALDQAVDVLGRSGSDAPRDSDRLARERALFDALQNRNYAAMTPDDGDAAAALIHGDCKLNNLLFAAHDDRVVAVLDLDTMMHGPWWLDFGDLVRSATCSDAGEFNQAWYPALVKGFFAGRKGVDQQKFQQQVHPHKQAQLGAPLARESSLAAAVQAPAYMTYMLCVRFFTDHLLGDQYFRVAQHGDNLRRAEEQYRLLTTLENAATKRFMRGVLEEFLPAR